VIYILSCIVYCSVVFGGGGGVVFLILNGSLADVRIVSTFNVNRPAKHEPAKRRASRFVQ
jgi:hypothetical protein